MAHIVEVAKSGRASCRTCRNAIPKGELRFGEESVNAFSDSGEMSYRWHHLKCAAGKMPNEVKAALAAFEGEVPNREEIDKILSEAAEKAPPPFPYADRAPTGRAKCIACREPIAKDAPRVAVEREIDRGMGNPVKGAGYLHPKCVRTYVEEQGAEIEPVVAGVREHSRGLSKDEIEQIVGEI